MYFFVGISEPSQAAFVGRPCMISVNRLRRRRGDFEVEEWLMDSGAFTEISTHRDYRDAPEAYAAEIARWSSVGALQAAVTQDYMCEPEILALTGGSVAEHQRRTIARYDAISAELARLSAGVYLMPTLQGYELADYLQHLAAYGDRLPLGGWVGLGSVCKRNRYPDQIAAIAQAVKDVRPDLQLHGFGVKTTALADERCRSLLFSADSMAWSQHERKNGRSPNNWRAAADFADRFYEDDFCAL